MARRGDGLVLRGKTWWLDFILREVRHQVRLGKNIKCTVAGEVASVERAKILRGEAGIGGKKRKDLAFDDAARAFLEWTKTNRRPKTFTSYRTHLNNLLTAFKGMKLSQTHPFLIEKYKQTRLGSADVRFQTEAG